MPARRKVTGPCGTWPRLPAAAAWELAGYGAWCPGPKGRPRGSGEPVKGRGDGDAGTEGQVGRLGCGGGERTRGRGPGVAVDRLAAGRGRRTASAAADLHEACLSRVRGRPACTVLRGPGRSNAAGLPATGVHRGHEAVRTA